ncbi:MAG TPA: dihydroorotase [Spirochaetota bacterium]|nr:dihydroorotase [Spirochaetota bacterium]HNT09542.1 dihydroorotase [Spirochaetota bacterium]HOS39252.1 dihydroorotase [Spirochaetota bacterium]
MKLVIKNGRVIDPASHTDDRRDVLVEDGFIAKIAANIADSADETIDAAGCVVLPGLIDMHVHFREPGREDIETIIGGSTVAAKGGFTSVCTMPNTVPPIDNQALVRFIKLEAEQGPINIFPIATITKGGQGEEISEMGELVKVGAVGFSDDGKPVMSSIVMRRALEYARMFDVPIITHSEDAQLANGGIMNEGANSVLLGLPGIPKAAEEVMIARDMILARLAKGRVHVAHVSSGGSVEIIRRAKSDAVRVTCETAPHYFALTDDAVEQHLSMAKMNPPLRTEEDRQAIIAGLRDGSVDVIATDHAPHPINEKMQEIEYAPFGIIGLETAVPLIVTVLVRENGFSLLQAFEKVTINPARILKLDRGALQEGAAADITVIDPEKKVLIDQAFIASKCKNTPFLGRELYGSVEWTICGGRVVYRKG